MAILGVTQRKESREKSGKNSLDLRQANESLTKLGQ